MKDVQFNINDYCSFILTGTGAAILNRHNHHSNLQFEKLGIDLKSRTDYRAGDTFKDQFWSVMQLFGAACGLGKEAPFNTCLITLHVRS